MPPDTTVGDCVVVVGVVVAGVVVAEEVSDVDALGPELDEAGDVAPGVDPVPAVVDGVELPVVSAVAVVPGISLETTSPSTAADTAETIATVLDMRRALVVAMSRRLASSRRGRGSGRRA